MKKSLFTMEHARQLTEDTYELVLSGDTSAITAPGQFVNIELPGKFLRRPISICNWTDDALMLLVKVVGQGTRELVRCVPGTELDVLSGLGNGFDAALAGENPILVGGGIGIAPIYGLARRMKERAPLVALGFRSAAMALTDRSLPLDDPRPAAEERLALVMGTEGDGLPEATIARCHYTLRIPMAHGVDSLNVAAAAAVACWQLRLQRA